MEPRAFPNLGKFEKRLLVSTIIFNYLAHPDSSVGPTVANKDLRSFLVFGARSDKAAPIAGFPGILRMILISSSASGPQDHESLTPTQ
jgi:hypothetical protein